MKNFRLLYVVAFSSLLLSSCKKENWDDAAFRCKVNGKEFIATNKFANANMEINTGQPHVLRVSGTRLVNFFNKKALDGEMKLNGMSFYDHEINTQREGGSQFLYFGNNSLDKTIRSNNSISPGWYIIDVFDKDNKKISGRFEVTAYDEDGGVYEITEGFFDVEYDD